MGVPRRKGEYPRSTRRAQQWQGQWANREDKLEGTRDSHELRKGCHNREEPSERTYRSSEPNNRAVEAPENKVRQLRTDISNYKPRMESNIDHVDHGT